MHTGNRESYKHTFLQSTIRESAGWELTRRSDAETMLSIQVEEALHDSDSRINASKCLLFCIVFSSLPVYIYQRIHELTSHESVNFWGEWPMPQIEKSGVDIFGLIGY